MPKVSFKPGIISETTPYDVGNGYVGGNLMRWRAGRAATIGGWQRIGSPEISGVARTLMQFASLGGATRIGIGTNSNVYVLESDVYYDITPVGFVPGPVDASPARGWGIGGWGLGGWGIGVAGPTDPISEIIAQPMTWSLDNFGEDLVINPRGGGIYVWDSNYNDRATLLASSPLAINVPNLANEVFISKRTQQAIALGCVPFGGSDLDPMQVRWSSTQDIYDWFPTSANSAGGQRLSGGSQIIGHLETYQETLIWTDTTVYSMQYLATNAVWGFVPVGTGMSIISPRAAMGNGTTTFWMDRGCFFAYSGSIQELPCPIKQEIYNNINLLQAWKFFAAHNHSFGEITWYYCTADSTEINAYATYNYRDNLWSKGRLQRTAWSDAGKLSTPIGVDVAGVIYLHETGDDADDVALPFSLETGDMDIQDGSVFTLLTRIIPDFKFTGTAGNYQQFAIDYRVRDSSTEPYKTLKTTIVTPNFSNGGNIDKRVRGRRVSLVFRSNGTLGTAWTMGTLQADIQPNGRR